MFEVGKKYKHDGNEITIFECVAMWGDKGWMKAINSDEPWTSNWNTNWKEYKPPVVHKRWVYFFKQPNFGYGDKVLGFSCEDPNWTFPNTIILNRQEVTYTEE